jgi:hypothetical protein
MPAERIVRILRRLRREDDRGRRVVIVANRHGCSFLPCPEPRTSQASLGSLFVAVEGIGSSTPVDEPIVETEANLAPRIASLVSRAVRAILRRRGRTTPSSTCRASRSACSERYSAHWIGLADGFRDARVPVAGSGALAMGGSPIGRRSQCRRWRRDSPCELPQGWRGGTEPLAHCRCRLKGGVRGRRDQTPELDETRARRRMLTRRSLFESKQ